MNHRGPIASAACVVLLVLAGAAAGQETRPSAEAPRSATVAAGRAELTVEARTGMVMSLRLGADEEMTRPHPAGGQPGIGYVEVTDLRDRRTYNPFATPATVTGWRVQEQAGGQRALEFVQQYQGAPFTIAHRIAPGKGGLRWEARLRLAEGERQNRSLVVSWVLPAPFGWWFWAPADVVAHRTDGVTPYRYVYGHTDLRPYGTIIPLAGLWGDQEGLAVFCPPDVHKPQVMFDIHTQDISDPPRGVRRGPEDLQSLRVSHHMVGLRPDKDLVLAVVLAGCRPDWRAVLGHYVTTFPELFEPIAATRKYEGMYGIRAAGRMSDATVEQLAARGATSVEIHGHFPEYSVYITPEAMKDPDLTWVCRPHRAREPSLAGNRRLFADMMAKGVYPFPYYYNVHADMQTVQRLFPDDVVRDEQNRPIIQYQGQPGLRATPESAYGRHLLAQIDLLMTAYPDVPGFFVDNYSIQMVDFAHDDGVTMAHNRPCYDMNLNHQTVGTAAAERMHKAGKVVMVNKLATIESGRGVDMVLLEGVDAQSIRANALACVFRSFFPLIWTHPDRRNRTERCLQYLLIWGGVSSESLCDRGGEPAVRAYRPLTDAMIGKRWVFDFDPLTLPDGYDGQVFRIDPHAPRAGDVVVSIVDLWGSWQQPRFTEGLSVSVRLPEVEKVKSVTFIGPETSADGPKPCRFDVRGREAAIQLPPMGAAGIVRLSARPQPTTAPTTGPQSAPI